MGAPFIYDISSLRVKQMVNYALKEVEKTRNVVYDVKFTIFYYRS